MNENLNKGMNFLKNKNFWVGLCLTFFMLVGVCLTCSFLWHKVGDIINRTSKKEELANFIEPVLMCDPFPFSEGEKISNSLLLQSALNNIFLNSGKEYHKSADGEFVLPQSDVEVSAKELFGDITNFKHGSLRDLSDFYCNYRPEESAYYVQYSTQASVYYPKVLKIEKDGGYLNLTVGYMRPRRFETRQKEELEPDKNMVYRLKKNKSKHGYMIVAVKDVESLSL